MLLASSNAEEHGIEGSFGGLLDNTFAPKSAGSFLTRVRAHTGIKPNGDSKSSRGYPYEWGKFTNRYMTESHTYASSRALRYKAARTIYPKTPNRPKSQGGKHTLAPD
ncbi:hypothetical protein PoB_002692300 [Plakobranchus ocellatus]|uniref:Uncharacterized protein n=1 Tax=Plakobranchus ocellatus TaxID=259542 RepID=A0AAV4A1B7_9GAST|nr:hypothetical protein PoB_002692300 [Plakobranchus ocellatus]